LRRILYATFMRGLKMAMGLLVLVLWSAVVSG
jgi:hypothetical protein